jgi:hypothetical protein
MQSLSDHSCLEPIRDYLVSEHLLSELALPQAAAGEIPLVDPLTRLEIKLQTTTVKLNETSDSSLLKPRNLHLRAPVAFDLKLTPQGVEIEWSKERLASGAKIFQFVVEQASKAQRAHYVANLVHRELKDHIDYFWGGFYFYALDAAVRINASFPDEKLINHDHLAQIFRRALALGGHVGEFALQAFAAVPAPGLGERLAKEIPVAPGVSLAEFPGKLRTKKEIRALAREMSFPAYSFYALWRLDREWAESRVPSILEFMVASHAASDSEFVFFLLTCYPTPEFESMFGAAKANSERGPDAGKSWQDIVRGWTSFDLFSVDTKNPDIYPSRHIIPLVLILQETPRLIRYLEKLAPIEAHKSSQIVVIMELIYLQYGGSADGTEFCGRFLFYSGKHTYMPAVYVPPRSFSEYPREISDALQCAYELRGDELPTDCDPPF